MKKLYAIVVVLLLTIGVLTGCNVQDDKTDENQASDTKVKQEETGFPVSLKDGLDQDVVIDQRPEKIVSLIPSNTEIAYSLGLGEEIAGVTDSDNYPKEALDKEKIGGLEINIEKIISLKPDLVLAHASTANSLKEGLDQLRNNDITVLVVNDAQSFEEVYKSIEMIGKATGVENKAKEIINSMKERLVKIKEKSGEITDKKKVYIEVSGAPEIYTTGKQTFMDEMLHTINAENIAGDQEGWIKMDQEAIIKRNPDVIITTYGAYVKDAKDQILSRDGWGNVKAIQNKQVFDVNSDLVTRTGPRIIEGVEELAKAVYPEVFK